MRRVLIYLLISILAPAVIFAGTVVRNNPLSKESSSTQANIADYVSADGRIDLAALQASGHQWSLKLEVAGIRIDPMTGAPETALTNATTPDPDDIYWDNSLSPSVAGTDRYVSAATIFDNKLVVAARFSVVGDTKTTCDDSGRSEDRSG